MLEEGGPGGQFQGDEEETGELVRDLVVSSTSARAF